MLNNIYTSLSGAVAQEQAMDIIANNLANLNTVGFKGESVTFTLLNAEPQIDADQPLPPANYKISMNDLFPLRGNEISYVGISGIHKDLSQGSPIETKNPFDLMIEGDGFFSVNTPEGVRYTRNGAFSLNAEGALIDQMGNTILGEKGTIFLKDQKVEINRLGEIYQGETLLDRIQIIKFENSEQLQNVGKNYLFFDGDSNGISRIDMPTLKQGYLESSNVNAIKNLTQLILAHRSYEAYHKAIKNMDGMMDKSSNVIGQTA